MIIHVSNPSLVPDLLEFLTRNPDEKGMKAPGSYVDNNGYAIPEAYEGVYDSLPGVYEVYA